MLTYFSSAVLLATSVSAAGLYGKNSAVLQVDASNYDKLIAKSNYTSIVEYYAPWCGHCQNLKPAYEKAATALSGVAKVAAINCDDEGNKPFCGRMGVTGFPTLKIVKPSKAGGGKSVVEDYQGARTAKAIHEIMTEKIPNHVSRPKDDDIDDWLKKNDRPKVLFFTEKRVIGSMVKGLAIDFLGAVDIGQVISTQKQTITKFNVQGLPEVYLVPGVDQTPEKYGGDMKKQALKDFISKFATPNPEFPSSSAPKAKASSSKKEQKASSQAKSASGEASCPMGHTGKNPHIAHSETASDKAVPTEGLEFDITEEDEKPEVPPPAPSSDPGPAMESLSTEETLKKLCLNNRVGTCLLALLPSGVSEDASSLGGIKEIAQKHVARRMKLFPFYTVPSGNSAGKSLLSKLGIDFDKTQNPLLMVINLKKNWWHQYAGSSMETKDLENWIDNIRFGDFKKAKLAEGVAESIIGTKEGKVKDEL